MFHLLIYRTSLTYCKNPCSGDQKGINVNNAMEVNRKRGQARGKHYKAIIEGILKTIKYMLFRLCIDKYKCKQG